MLFDQLTPLEETQFYKDVIRIGTERGIEAGHRKGLSEGLDQGWTESVLDLLTLKFPDAPQTMKKRIPKLSKTQKQQLFKLIVKSESLTEVRQWLNRDTN